MSSLEQNPVYELLDGEALEDYRALENLVDEAVENERSMTSASLPDGFIDDTIDEADFGFEASKEYDDGTEITLQYDERSRSFNRPDSSSVQIDVDIPYSFTRHWDQRR